MDTGSFLGVKRPGRGVDHPPPSSAEIEGSEELYICPLWAFVACYVVNFTFIYEVTSAVQIFLEEPDISIFRVAAGSSSDPTYVPKYINTKL
jgi:hypothetical protein